MWFYLHSAIAGVKKKKTFDFELIFEFKCNVFKLFLFGIIIIIFSWNLNIIELLYNSYFKLSIFDGDALKKDAGAW